MEICFDAFALGNHEFDDGDAGLAAFLDELKSGDWASFGLNAQPHYFTPHGMKIGVMLISRKTKQSSIHHGQHIQSPEGGGCYYWW